MGLSRGCVDMLHCEGSGSLDLGEIYQCRPWECCAFDLRILTFAYSLRERPPGTSEQRIWNFVDPALWGFPVGFPWVCMLHCEGSGSLDLGEIYQCRPSECCAFDLRILTFAYSLKEKLPRTPRQAHIELRTPCTLCLLYTTDAADE